MMHVSLESIEKAIKNVDNLDDQGLEQVSEKYALAQPVLLSYLMSAALEYENEQLEGLIIYYFCVISDAFTQEGLKTVEVSETSIDEFEEPFFDMLDEYFENEDDDFLEDFCDQPHLVQFMAMEISTEDEDGTALSDETATQLFIVTLALITLMGRVIES